MQRCNISLNNSILIRYIYRYLFPGGEFDNMNDKTHLHAKYEAILA